MTFTEQFLHIDLTAPKNVLIKSFIKAIYEIRSEELGTNIEHLEQHGDKQATAFIKKNSVQDICLHTDNVKIVEDVPLHAKNIIDNYIQNNAVTVFRGTRLPLPNSSFNNGFVHTTPHIATSSAYAVGISNGYGGIGRILTEDNDNTGLGFIHAYEAPLSTKIYKNFQFERFLNSTNPDSEVTLSDFKKQLESFTKLDKHSFTVDYISDNNLYGNINNKAKMSPNMQKWYDFISSTKCMETPYYEVMLPDSCVPKHTFLIDKNNKIIQLDINNPKTRKILQHLQSLLLKDFYEINPLDKLLNEIENNISSIKDKSVKMDSQLLELLNNESLLLTELKNSVVIKIEKIKKHSSFSNESIEDLMQQSAMIGSTNMIGEPRSDSKIKYSQDIENFILDTLQKKQQIEVPLEEYLQSISLPSEKQLNSNSLNLLDKLLDKISEKNIPNNLLLKKVDTDSVMLDFMRDIEKKLKLEQIVNPTIGHFVNKLQTLKKNDLLRQYVGKTILSDNYQPFMQFIERKTLNQYSSINTFTQKEKNISTISHSIKDIRSKFLNTSEKTITKNY